MLTRDIFKGAMSCSEIHHYFPLKSRHLSKNPSRAQTTQKDQSDKPMKWKSIASEMVFLLKYRKMPTF